MAINKDKKRILYIAQEIAPFVEETTVGEEAHLFPLSMLERGHDIRTFMPDYGVINERRNQLHEVIRLSGVNLTVNDKVHQLVVKVASLMPQRLQVYFIENDDFFERKGTVCDKEGVMYSDNAERAVFFVRGVFETIKKLRWIPDVIHCQGWFSGLAPLYLSTMLKDDPALSKSKVVFSFPNKIPDQPFGDALHSVLSYDSIESTVVKDEPLSRSKFLGLALDACDGIVISDVEIAPEERQWVEAKGLPLVDIADVTSAEAMDRLEDFYESL